VNDAREQLTADLEAAALRALAGEWETTNRNLFRGLMVRPTFGLIDARGLMGRWMRAPRAMEFARATLLDHPWGVVVEVLKHEMAHQYVDEVLGRTDETAHGPAFQAVCADRGLDARAAGVPEERARSEGEAAVLDRIRKLLALAESPNEHEAQAAMNAAQRLMLKYNLDTVAGRAARGYAHRHLGEATGRVDEAARFLAHILEEHFFVECIWVTVWRVREGMRGSVLEACGTPESLDMAAYVHSFLHHTADGLWEQHKRLHQIRGDRDRRAYRAGVMQGFLAKLNTERRSNQEKGLVWVGDPALETYYRKRHPYVRTIRRAGSGNADARAHGHAAGRNLVLHKGVSSSGGGGGGQLGPGGG